MKKFAIAILLFVLIPAPVKAFASDKMPEVEAQGAVLMDFETGRVLWQKEAHKKLAMASTTKIMTAILAFELTDTSEIVTVSKNAASAPPVKIYLSTGEKISMEALLLAMMLQSSNDAAVAIAEHIGGTVEEFCEMMTSRAYELGARDTVFETPNGLDSENHSSTAYDMAVITRHALSIPGFGKLINTKSATVSSDIRSYEIKNKNRLLDEFDGANGVKTGYTGKAGYCFVGAAKRGDMQLISVVLASGWGGSGKERKWTDTKRILKYGFDNFEYSDIITESTIAATLNVLRSKTQAVELVYSGGLKLPLTEAEKAGIKVELELPEYVKAPVVPGETHGKAKIRLGEELLAEVPLIAQSGAKRHDLKTCLEKTANSLLGLTTKKDPGIILPEWFYSE